MPDSWPIVALCFAVFEPFGAQVDLSEEDKAEAKKMGDLMGAKALKILSK